MLFDSLMIGRFMNIYLYIRMNRTIYDKIMKT